MKNLLVLTVLASLVLIGCTFKVVDVNLNQNLNNNKNTSLANPASIYCEQNSGKLEIRKDETGGEYGVCIFSDGSECDEWAYFREECKPGENKKP